MQVIDHPHFYLQAAESLAALAAAYPQVVFPEARDTFVQVWSTDFHYTNASLMTVM